MDFSEAQLEFIGAPFDKDTLVVAPPGSGKSMTTRTRVAYMIMRGVPADKILVTMFNKPAAVEFRQSYSEMNVAAMPSIRHYHSLGYRLCKNFMARGILPSWRLEDREFIWRKMAFDVLRKAVAEHGSSDVDVYDTNVIDAFVSFIDYCKSDVKPATTMFERIGLSSHLAPFSLAFDLYEERREQHQLRSFNDLIYDVVKALKRDVRCRKLVENRLEQIIIDEYQDINPIVQDLFSIMAGDRAKTTGIGDDDQTIFEWRGSDPLVMSDSWDSRFKDSQKFTLKNTFRYGHSLAMAANNCIFHNKNRAPKMCLSDQSTPQTNINVGYYATPSFGAESYTDTRQQALIESIQMFVNDGNSYSDIAILPRLYQVTPFFELALFRAGIPYSLSSGKSVCNQPIFYALEALATLCQGTNNSDTGKLFNAVLMTPNPGVKASAAPALFSLFNAVENPTSDDVKTVIPESKPFVHKRVTRRLEAIKKSMSFSTPAESFHAYISDYLIDDLERSQNKNSSKAPAHTIALANGFYELACQGSDFGTLLNTINTLKATKPESENAVRIMSQHMAKGITVGMAIIPACCETITPAIVPGKNTDISAERRLFYVGITRPTKQLLLLLPNDKAYQKAFAQEQCRPPEGHSETADSVSRFVYEMNISGALRVAKEIHPDASGDLPTTSTAKNFNQYLSRLNVFMRVNNNA